jgi:hypothetical protein
MKRSYGGECMLGCFFNDATIGSYDSDYKSDSNAVLWNDFNAGIKTTGAYGQGGWSGFTADDNDDQPYKQDAYSGIQGWVRVYYMRKPLT